MKYYHVGLDFPNSSSMWLEGMIQISSVTCKQLTYIMHYNVNKQINLIITSQYYHKMSYSTIRYAFVYLPAGASIKVESFTSKSL